MSYARIGERYRLLAMILIEGRKKGKEGAALCTRVKGPFIKILNEKEEGKLILNGSLESKKRSPKKRNRGAKRRRRGGVALFPYAEDMGEKASLSSFETPISSSR